MNERLLEAIKKLKEEQNEIEIDLKTLKREVEEKGTLNMQKALFAVADDLARYTIVDGNWYYNGKDTGIRAEGIEGEDGKDGAPGKDGKDGKPGKDGKDGKDGKPGINGKDGKPGINGKDGKDGKDGETPELKIGKVETSPEYGASLAKLRKGKGNIVYLDLTLPRGPQGFPGFDGKPGQDAKINGVNTLNIEAGDNITLEQDDDTLTISSTGGTGIVDQKYDSNSQNAQSGIAVEEGIRKNIEDDPLSYSGTKAMTANAVQTLVTGGLSTKQDILTFDYFPMYGSTNPITSDAVYGVQQIAEGAQRAISKQNYQELINILNTFTDLWQTGQTVYIETLNVPDVWLTLNTGEYVTYTYTSDADFVDYITNGSGKVGMYIVRPLETLKQDITTKEDKINKVTSISSSSTDLQYPSAKCVYDEFQNKQDTLVSGTNIKTINNQDLLGSGNITISGGSGTYELFKKIIVGYELLTSEPVDWSTNYNNYYKTNGKEENDFEFNYIALESAETFEANKYYSKNLDGSSEYSLRFSNAPLDNFIVLITHMAINSGNIKISAGNYVYDYNVIFRYLNVPASLNQYCFLRYEAFTKNLYQVFQGKSGSGQNLTGVAATGEIGILDYNNYITNYADKIDRISIGGISGLKLATDGVIYIYTRR